MEKNISCIQVKTTGFQETLTQGKEYGCTVFFGNETSPIQGTYSLHSVDRSGEGRGTVEYEEGLQKRRVSVEVWGKLETKKSNGENYFISTIKVGHSIGCNRHPTLGPTGAVGPGKSLNTPINTFMPPFPPTFIPSVYPYQNPPIPSPTGAVSSGKPLNTPINTFMPLFPPTFISSAYPYQNPPIPSPTGAVSSGKPLGTPTTASPSTSSSSFTPSSSSSSSTPNMYSHIPSQNNTIDSRKPLNTQTTASPSTSSSSFTPSSSSSSSIPNTNSHFRYSTYQTSTSGSGKLSESTLHGFNSSLAAGEINKITELKQQSIKYRRAKLEFGYMGDNIKIEIVHSVVELFTRVYNKCEKNLDYTAKALNASTPWTMEHLAGIMGVCNAFRLKEREDQSKTIFVMIIIKLMTEALSATKKENRILPEHAGQLVACMDYLASFDFFLWVGDSNGIMPVTQSFLEAICNFVAMGGVSFSPIEAFHIISSLMKLGFVMGDPASENFLRTILPKIISAYTEGLKQGGYTLQYILSTTNCFKMMNLGLFAIKEVVGKGNALKFLEGILRKVTESVKGSVSLRNLTFSNGGMLQLTPLMTSLDILGKLANMGCGGDILLEALEEDGLKEFLEAINSIAFKATKEGDLFLGDESLEILDISNERLLAIRKGQIESVILGSALTSLTTMLAFENETRTRSYLSMIKKMLDTMIIYSYNLLRERGLFYSANSPIYRSLGLNLLFLTDVFPEINELLELKIQYVEPSGGKILGNSSRDHRETNTEMAARRLLEEMLKNYENGSSQLEEEYGLYCEISYILQTRKNNTDSNWVTATFEHSFDFKFEMHFDGKEYVVFLEMDGPMHFTDSLYRKKTSRTIKRDITSRKILEIYAASEKKRGNECEYIYVVIPKNVIDKLTKNLRKHYRQRELTEKSLLLRELLEDGIRRETAKSVTLIDSSNSPSPNPSRPLSGQLSPNPSSPASSDDSRFSPYPDFVTNIVSDGSGKGTRKTISSFSKSNSGSSLLGSHSSPNSVSSIDSSSSENGSQGIFSEEFSPIQVQCIAPRQRPKTKEIAGGYGQGSSSRAISNNFFDDHLRDYGNLVSLFEPLEFTPGRGYGNSHLTGGRNFYRPSVEGLHDPRNSPTSQSNSYYSNSSQDRKTLKNYCYNEDDFPSLSDTHSSQQGTNSPNYCYNEDDFPNLSDTHSSQQGTNSPILSNPRFNHDHSGSNKYGLLSSTSFDEDGSYGFREEGPPNFENSPIPSAPQSNPNYSGSNEDGLLSSSSIYGFHQKTNKFKSSNEDDFPSLSAIYSSQQGTDSPSGQNEGQNKKKEKEKKEKEKKKKKEKQSLELIDSAKKDLESNFPTFTHEKSKKNNS
ncbi:MAG: hypothetical protein LBU15_02490 [Rickettsiales bacterium]|jgi:hypothetical protein|nr:hypothetical protein [Rickettsiales bacterium]